MVRLSFNICSWQAPSSLDDSLASIAVQEGLEFTETILVNNGFPADRAAELQARYPFVRMMAEPVVGLARARQAGFRASRGEFLVCIDDDNVLGDGFLIHLFDLIDRHANLGCIRPVVVPRWEKTPPPAWLQEYGLYCLSYTHLDPSTEVVLHRERISAYPEFKEWGRPPGGGMIIHRDLAASYLSRTDSRRLKLGRIGNSLGGSEDLDILDGLPFSRRDGAYSQRLMVYHQIPETRTRIPYLLNLNFQRNRDCAVFERMMLREKHPFATDSRRAHWKKIGQLGRALWQGKMKLTLFLLELVRPLGFFYGWGRDALREAFSAKAIAPSPVPVSQQRIAVEGEESTR
jgi:glycosyltransferase involved in cell wall biosynthesis